MLLTSVFAIVLISYAHADGATTEEVPFVVAAKDGSDVEKVSNLLPELDVPLTYQPTGRGRSDIEIEEERPFVGYFYPKPEKPFNLPDFKTVNPDASIASFAGDDSFEAVDRSPRSSKRRPPYFRPGFIPPSKNDIPPFIPGFIPPPNHIRPRPGLYGQRQ